MGNMWLLISDNTADPNMMFISETLIMELYQMNDGIFKK